MPHGMPENNSIEFEEIMRGGKINYAKSDVKQSPARHTPLKALRTTTSGVRIIFAQCDVKTKVVTSIDLDTDWECHCPGDDSGSTSSPHKNR
jgi:hypothetical protein